MVHGDVEAEPSPRDTGGNRIACGDDNGDPSGGGQGCADGSDPNADGTCGDGGDSAGGDDNCVPGTAGCCPDGSSGCDGTAG